MAESVFDRNINLSNFRIRNLGTAVDPNDAVSKRDLDLQKSKIFDNVETFQLTSSTLSITLSNPTDVYSCLVFHNGLVKSPSTEDSQGNVTIRDYQILTFSTYSEINYTSPIDSGTQVSVFYNTVINQ